MKLTPEKIEAINRDLGVAVRSTLESHGVKLTQDFNSKFTDTFADVKFRYEVEGVTFAKEAFSFKNYCTRHGLEKADLGKMFKHKGQDYKIVGLRTRARKAPIMIERKDGKVFNSPASIVIEGLGKPEVFTFTPEPEF